MTLFSIFKADTLNVSPFVHSFDPEDKNERTFQYYISNTTSDFLAFEISVYKRDVNVHGKDILTKDKTSFKLRPSQIIIPPNSYRNIKVKWIGNEDFRKNPKNEQAFRVVMSQFPIDLGKKITKKNAQINVLYKIQTTLYVTPKNAKSDLKLISSDSNVIVLKNFGTKRAIVSQTNLLDGNKPILDLIKKADLETVVLPGHTRIYRKIKK